MSELLKDLNDLVAYFQKRADKTSPGCHEDWTEAADELERILIVHGASKAADEYLECGCRVDDLPIQGCDPGQHTV